MAHSGSRVIQITESTATEQQQQAAQKTSENTTPGPSNEPENKETRLRLDSGIYEGLAEALKQGIVYYIRFELIADSRGFNAF